MVASIRTNRTAAFGMAAKWTSCWSYKIFTFHVINSIGNKTSDRLMQDINCVCGLVLSNGWNLHNCFSEREKSFIRGRHQMKMRKAHERIHFICFSCIFIFAIQTHMNMMIGWQLNSIRAHIAGGIPLGWGGERGIVSKNEPEKHDLIRRIFRLQNHIKRHRVQHSNDDKLNARMRERWNCIFTRQRRHSVLFMCRRAIRKHESGMTFLCVHFCRAITNWRRRYFERNYFMKRAWKCNATIVFRAAEVWNAGTKSIWRTRCAIFLSHILQRAKVYVLFVDRGTTYLIVWNRGENGKLTYASTTATIQALKRCRIVWPTWLNSRGNDVFSKLVKHHGTWYKAGISICFI